MVGARAFGFIPAEYGKPVVISGFEPLDMLQSLRLVLRQLVERRCEVENQYTRVVPDEGNPQALAALDEVFELRPQFEWRGLGVIARSGLKLNGAFAGFDAELRFPVPGPRVTDPKACQCGEVLKGVIKPWECTVFGTACTPERPIGTGMVSKRRRLRRLLQPRPSHTRTGDGMSNREREALELIERVRSRPARFRDERITMAHGAGGRATLTLIEGLLAPAFGLETLADAAAVDGFALTTDSFVVKPLRFPGGSIGELAVNGTVNDLAVTGARPLAQTLSLVLEEGLGADELRHEVDAAARAAETAGVRVVAGDTKVVERGRCDGMYSAPPASAGSTRVAGSIRPRLAPAIASFSRAGRRARRRDHARARRVRARGGGPLRHAVALARRRCAARGGRRVGALRPRRHSRRCRLGVERARPVLRNGDARP